MSNKSKIVILTVNILLCAAMALLTVFLMDGWGVLARVVFYCIAGAGIIVSLIAFFLKKDAIFKSAFILVICAAAFLIAFIVVGKVGHINDYETDEEK